jgi:hypothetical protein
MKIAELEQPIIGDIIEFETDADTVVEGIIVAETEDGYIYEFSDAGLVALTEANKAKQKDRDLEEAHPNSKIYDKCWDGYKKVPGKKRGESGSCKKIDEAEYQGRDVPLGKPMAGDVKKSKVYVRNEKGTVVKVNFGDPNMRIKKSSPARRKSFRARHNCSDPGPRWKARYWSCRAW